jgi:hypothetical protein
MNVPGEQHPTRPVEGGKGHPHNVRVKPLEVNTKEKRTLLNETLANQCQTQKPKKDPILKRERKSVRT